MFHTLFMLGTAFITGSQAIYEKNKGINDWHIQNIGEVQDLKFVEAKDDSSHYMYSVTSDGVLSLFNLDTQTFDWKRQIKSQDSGETFDLSYLGRNLLVHSQQKGMLLNTAGHANIEVEYGSLFKSRGHVEAAMFDFDEQLYSCFVSGNSAVFYRAGKFLKSVQLDPAHSDEDLHVIAIRVDQHALLVLVRVGDAQLKTYSIDLASLSSSLSAQAAIGEDISAFSSHSRTASFVLLHGEQSTQMVNMRSLKVVRYQDTAQIQSNAGDDVVLRADREINQAVNIIDLVSGAEKQLILGTEACSAVRQQQTENWGNFVTSLTEDFKVAVNCHDLFKVMTPDGNIIFETRAVNLVKNGGVRRFFKKEYEPAAYVVQFEDMSLHLLSADKVSGQGLRLIWSREEGLSNLKQLEIVNEHPDNLKLEHNFDYVKHWNAEGSLAAAPQRILQRYAENVAFITKFLFSAAQLSEAQSTAGDSETDIYGFRRTLVALTNSAKIISFSSIDGSILWTSSFFKTSPLKVLLRQNFLSDLEVTETQIVACFADSLQFMSSLSGQVLYSQPLKILAS
jgi:hypothetical protein